MLSGEFNVTLDDAGRLSLPRKLRDSLETDAIILTKGADVCLWLYTAKQWKVEEKDIIDKTDQFSSRGRLIRQHFIGPVQELDLDRQGRVLIPPALREYAGLSKDCVVMGQSLYIEIWAEDRYKAHFASNKEAFNEGLEELSSLRMKERKLSNYGNNAHAGTAGGSHSVSGAEGSW